MDLELIETLNGGDLVKKPKDLSVISGLGNMPYLAMFGGNIESSTPVTRLETEQAFDFWANTLLFGGDPGQQMNSMTERTLLNTALTSQGRILIERAVLKDLAFMRPFAEVNVQATIPSTDTVRIRVTIQRPDNLQEREYIYIWDASKNELSSE